MPEYLAPGVFVEETSFRSKSIEGVSTSTTAFVGPTRSGPVDGTPELLTSFADFERIYGGLDDLDFASPAPTTNFIAHAVAAYFNEGGARLYVARVTHKDPNNPGNDDKSAVSADVVATKTSHFVARFPGTAGNGVVRVREITTPTNPTNAVSKLLDGTVVRVNGDTPTFFVKHAGIWRAADGSTATTAITGATNPMDVLTLNLAATDADGRTISYEGLGFDPQYKRFIGTILSPNPTNRADQLAQFFGFDVAGTVGAIELRTGFAALPKDPSDPDGNTRLITLSGGTDVVPTTGDYTDPLSLIEGLEDVAIIASPGHSHSGWGTDFAQAIANQLIIQAEKPRMYRIAVLDTPEALLPGGAQDYKAHIDSKYAALYYPWVVAPNPNFDPNDPREDAELVLPPSGFVCGIYARSDDARGVFKAPANEVINSALRFESLINTGQQELLNPLGVNCLRFFAGRGNRVWGARTTSSDPEWKYVNIRRYFLYLEHSIDNGTQWAVFEPNGERLWANVQDTISAFLYNEWVNGALLGDKPEQAYFVRCDRSTITQNNLDNGELVCLVGVAAIKPAEFVIFRIGQKTADTSS